MKKFAYPYYLFLLVFVLLPLLLIITYALTTGNSMVIESLTFSLEHVKRFFEPIYLSVLWRSIQLALISTVFCLIIGYPLAKYIAEQPLDKRNNMILLIVIPMWMNFLLRTYAWLTLLNNTGPINAILKFVGLGPVNLLYNDTTVVLGMIYNFLPFMILPIYSVMVKMDRHLIEAAQDLGATERQVFWKVVFPLSLPGVISGITMVFIPAVSTFVISNLLGGNKYSLIGNLIEQQFRFTGDWHFGSAMSLGLIVIIFAGIFIMSKLGGTGAQERGRLW